MAGAAALWWVWRRGSNSSREDEPEASSTRDVDADVEELLDAVGAPYFFGRGSPSTPWSELDDGVDCSGFAQIALVRLGLLDADATDRGARELADDSDPVELGHQEPGDLAYYPGHVMVVVGYPDEDGHSPVLGASGGDATTFGGDENAYVKLFDRGDYRDDFVTYMRLRS